MNLLERIGVSELRRVHRSSAILALDHSWTIVFEVDGSICSCRVGNPDPALRAHVVSTWNVDSRVDDTVHADRASAVLFVIIFFDTLHYSSAQKLGVGDLIHPWNRRGRFVPELLHEEWMAACLPKTEKEN